MDYFNSMAQAFNYSLPNPVNIGSQIGQLLTSARSAYDKNRESQVFAKFNGSNWNEIAQGLAAAGFTDDAMKAAALGTKQADEYTANPITGELYNKRTGLPQSPQVAAPSAGSVANAIQPKDTDIQLLQANPQMADAFDQKFGKGASQKILSPTIQAPTNPIANKAFQVQQGKNMAGAAKARATMDVVDESLDRLKQQASELKSDPGLGLVTGSYKIMGHETPIPASEVPNYPGGQAAHAQAQFNTLKSQVVQNVLAQFRAQSATGGALGQVSNYEDRLLQANLAALEQAQSTADVQKALDKIIKFVDDSKALHRKAYNAQFGGQ